MEQSAEDTGYLFLGKTRLQEKPVQAAGNDKPKVCGVCEPSASLIHLPSPAEIPTDPSLLFDILESRRTVRKYSSDNLMRWELSLLLHYTQGVSESGDAPHLRTVPSAAALHPFETYIVVNRVDGLVPGIYRYLPLDHAIVKETCHIGDNASIARACRRPELVSGSAVTFIWTAIPDRILWKFGPRGWRYLFIEAGHICQNLYLAGSALGCGVCAVGSYRDDEMNCALGIDGQEQFCIYLATVGKKL